MGRRLLPLFVLALLVPPARAQEPGEPLRLTLHPAATPTPALRYRLLPDRRERTDGNAATLYYRTMAMFTENRALLADMGSQQWETWLNVPLKDLPLKDVRAKVRNYRNLHREMALAGRCRDCDWALAGRPEGLGLLLPEIQSYRSMARVLAVRVRLEVAERHWDDAVGTLQIGYALGHNMAKGPTIIHFLVGAAITQVMNRRLEELLEQPGAPNLYWSLAVLPHPFADPRHSLGQEPDVLEDMCPWLKKLQNGPISPAMVRDIERAIDKKANDFNLRRPTYGDALTQAVLRSATYPEARAFLRARGVPAEQVEAMPVLQAVALYAFGEYREAAEGVVKWASVPDGWRHPAFKKDAERWGKAVTRLDRLFFRGLLGGLFGGNPARVLERAERVRQRVERRLAAVRCLEALRLHAAAHDGKLPDALADVKEVPVPNDPASGKPFLYVRDGAKATLRSPLAPGEKGQSGEAVFYELTMKP